MSVYAISDLHLCLGVSKPMDVFGGEWEGYIDKIKENWVNLITDEDLVIIPGDLSWATYIGESVKDFKFLSNLPGRKIIIKGNHDYWWTTMTKLKEFVEVNNFKGISFLNNDSYREMLTDKNGIVICGTRGWKTPGEKDFSVEDKKLFEREVFRLELSLKSAKSKMQEGDKLVVAMHFPPFYLDCEENEFTKLFKTYSVKVCIFGHLHGVGASDSIYNREDEFGTKYCFVSADYLKFKPKKIF